MSSLVMYPTTTITSEDVFLYFQCTSDNLTILLAQSSLFLARFLVQIYKFTNFLWTKKYGYIWGYIYIYTLIHR